MVKIYKDIPLGGIPLKCKYFLDKERSKNDNDLRIEAPNIDDSDKSDALYIMELEVIIKCCLNWDRLSRYYKMSIKFMDKYKKYINWSLLLQYQSLGEEKINYFYKVPNTINKTVLIQNQTLSENFMVKNKDTLDLDLLCKYQILPLSFYNNKKIKAKIVSKYQPIDRIIENLKTGEKPIIDLDEIVMRPLKKEQIIFIWPTLDEFQRLEICKRSKIDISLLLELDMSFEIDMILKYQMYDELILEKIIANYDNVDFDILYKHQSLSTNFITKYHSKFPHNQTPKKKWYNNLFN